MFKIQTRCLRGQISKITAKDEALFYDFVRSYSVDKCSFENNWSYIIQATRGKGYKYQLDRSVVYFYFREANDSLVIVNCLGKNSLDMVTELALLVKEIGIITIVKNVLISELEKWENKGYKETIAPWSPYSFRDDNTFPEQVYSFTDIANCHLKRKKNEPKSRSCRKDTSRLIRKFIKERSIIALDYDRTKHKDIINKLLVNYANYLDNKGVDSSENVYAAHQFIFNEEIKNKTRIVHVEAEKIKGFSYLTLVDNVLFFNAIINENESNIMRFILWQALNFIKENFKNNCCPQYLCLQGSEISGQDFWKRSFACIRSIHKTHVYWAEPYPLITQLDRIETMSRLDSHKYLQNILTSNCLSLR